MHRRVMAVVAHMDDEVLGCGGTLAKHVAAGDDVHVCILCDRAYDHRVDRVQTSSEQAAAKQAQAILGYQQISFLGLVDEQLDVRLLDALVPVEECIRNYVPDVVYTHHRGDPHQDHGPVLKAVWIACRSLSTPHPQRILACEVPSATDVAPPFHECAFQPNFYVNIADHLESKIEAMAAYERESREFPHPRSPQGIRALAWKRGTEIGYHAAEAFMVLRDEWR